MSWGATRPLSWIRTLLEPAGKYSASGGERCTSPFIVKGECKNGIHTGAESKIIMYLAEDCMGSSNPND